MQVEFFSSVSLDVDDLVTWVAIEWERQLKEINDPIGLAFAVLRLDLDFLGVVVLLSEMAAIVLFWIDMLFQ